MSGDAAAYSVMVGIGETYLPAFVLALGMGDVLAGLIATVPMLAGAVLQLSSLAAVRWLGSNRRWVVLCATVQAASFVPLLIAALIGRIPEVLIFLIASVYWGAGLATGPAWNTWAGTIVPERIRARYFAKRSRIAQACVFAGFLAGGIALQIGHAYGRVLQTFALLFLVAGLCRFCSSRLLAGQSEPVPPDRSRKGPSGWQLMARLRGRHDGRLLAYLVSMQTAVYISAPYFNPYLLKQLRMSYASYVGLVAASYLTKAVALPALGKLAHRAGAHRLLWMGGVGIVPIAALWNISNDYGYLLFLQIVGGIAWAAYELGMFLLFFETIHTDERTGVLTIYNVGNALATVVGGFCGAAVLWLLGQSRESYLFLFAVSSWARAGTLFLLSRVPQRVAGTVTPAIRPISISPTASEDSPILPSLKDEEVDASAV